jgi:hypothetical protein
MQLGVGLGLKQALVALVNMVVMAALVVILVMALPELNRAVAAAQVVDQALLLVLAQQAASK